VYIINCVVNLSCTPVMSNQNILSFSAFMSTPIIPEPLFDDPSNQRLALSASKQHWPTVTCLPVVLFCQWITWRFFPPLVHWNIYTDSCKLATSCFHVWSSNQQLLTALNISARAGTCYVTRRRSRGSLNRDATINTYKIVQYGTNISRW
jgi:hypothetical protein